MGSNSNEILWKSFKLVKNLVSTFLECADMRFLKTDDGFINLIFAIQITYQWEAFYNTDPLPKCPVSTMSFLRRGVSSSSLLKHYIHLKGVDCGY